LTAQTTETSRQQQQRLATSNLNCIAATLQQQQQKQQQQQQWVSTPHPQDIGQTLPNCANNSRLSILPVNVVVCAIFPSLTLGPFVSCRPVSFLCSFSLVFLKYVTCLGERLV